MFETRDCTLKDFGDDKEGKKLFDSWKDFKLYCPSVPKGKSLVL